MVQLSNWFVSFLNLCSLLLGLASVSYAVYLLAHSCSSACQKSINVPLLITALLLTAISLLGFVASFWKLKSLLNAYLLVISLLILGLVIFAIFALFIASKEEQSSGNYELKKNYETWLEKHVVKKNWNKIRSCLIDSQICKKFHTMNNNADMAADSYMKNLSPVELGCCMQPDYCIFEHNNATLTMPETGGADNMQGRDRSDNDCNRWSNDIGRRCYYCNSCKDKVVEEIKKEWRFIAIADVCAAVFLIIVLSAACCSKNNTHPSDHPHKSMDQDLHI